MNLSGVKVIDWDLAAQQLTKHQTESLVKFFKFSSISVSIGVG